MELWNEVDVTYTLWCIYIIIVIYTIPASIVYLCKYCLRMNHGMNRMQGGGCTPSGDCGQNTSQQLTWNILHSQQSSLWYTRSSWSRSSKISAIKCTIAKYMQCHYKFFQSKFWPRLQLRVQAVVECHPLENGLHCASQVNTKFLISFYKYKYRLTHPVAY